MLSINCDSSISFIKEKVEESVFTSKKRLGWDKKISLLLHRADQLNTYNGLIWRHLVSLKNLGLIYRLGVSVQNTSEAIDALNQKEVSIIQLPLNILDWRWRESSIITKIKKRPDIEIHARSIYLQGILIREIKDWPAIKGVDSEKILKKIDYYVNKFNRESRKDLCMAWVRSQTWVNFMVIGMENLNQLFENIR